MCSKPEEVLLDENKEAAKHSFYNTGAVSVSPDNSLLCFAEDTVGGEKYNVRVIDLKTRKSILAQPIGDCSGNVVWAADSKTVFFAKQDDKMRPYQVCTRLNSQPCVFLPATNQYATWLPVRVLWQHDVLCSSTQWFIYQQGCMFWVKL
jgi:protease II